MSQLLITALMAERELASLLKAAGIEHVAVWSVYDDALDRTFMQVTMMDLSRHQHPVPDHALAYSLNQFSDEVLAPFVAKLKK